MSSTATSAEQGSAKPVNSRGRVIVASLIGTTVEFYDFYVYATAAVLVFPKLFFPGQNETTQLLSSFAVFGVAFVARPLGSVIFGHFGDKFGRKGTLVASLLTMGIATFLIGCLPTATVPGWTFWAPALLVVMRFAQGLALGGEWSGAALLATENAPVNKRAIYGTFPQLGAPIGFIIANVIFLVFSYTLTPAAFEAWGWRVPFLLSAVMVIIGLYVRLKLIETPAFTKVLESKEVAKLPLARVFKSSWRQLILGTFIMLATYVLFYLMTTYTLTYGTRASSLETAKAAAEKAGKPMTEAAAAAFVPGLGYTRNDFLWMLIAGVVFFGIFTLVSGPLAEKYGRRKMLIVVTAGIFVFGLLFVPLFSAGFVGTMALLIIGFSLMGLTFGPMGALLPELFPTNVRYTGSAISYNFSSILGAAVAPFIAVWLWELAKGSPVLVGIYLAAMSVLTLIALFVSKETRDLEYTNNVS
ncbi:MFS transporter [Arthrobacter sp. AL08]|uniref:MFS transporter n=1 Tax=Micrococcaceae TaxID=1268 RepID=UPI001CFF913C|nr:MULTISPECIES: MFS transporter [Micrococcaceae]MCB5280957.1 Inner membrane metabolite transport protein YhjE [Arthrobacter sp. ES1]MDI3240594.1 MFS transporter [Arthrobacter sp. AL05]MDI3276604.1 MFS transporter [Arthrobacter sp. AL08]MDJ0352058.1 MFS transporter [Pseudarthrobacter sp. PH31-O2]WGZ80299.1 MFS transporter [Arthrobacter sp. EM1]